MRSKSFCFSPAFSCIFLLTVISVARAAATSSFVFPVVQLVVSMERRDVVEQRLCDGVFAGRDTELHQLHRALEPSAAGTLAGDFRPHDLKGLFGFACFEGFLGRSVTVGSFCRPGGRGRLAIARSRIFSPFRGCGVFTGAATSCLSQTRVSGLAAAVSSSKLASSSSGRSFISTRNSERMASAMGAYSFPSPVKASTTKRCKSSQARLQGMAMAVSASSSSSLHFWVSASRLSCWRSSVGGASSRVASPSLAAARSSPQRSPRIIR